MAQNNADRLLTRITALHRSLQLDEHGHVSSMERDLMLGYLRELYEIYAAGTVPPPAPGRSTPPAEKPRPAERPRTPPPAPPTPPAAPLNQTPASVQAPPQPTPASQLVDPPTDPPQAMPPVPDAPVPPPPAPPVAVSNTTTVAEKPTPPPTAAEEPRVAPAPPPPASEESTASVASLFDAEPPSSRFGRQPLSDLTKALTINNRILFTRDLFGGNGDLLQTTLRTLNAAGAFSGARPVLENLAREYDWDAENKRETAGEFIELVRRRYA